MSIEKLIFINTNKKILKRFPEVKLNVIFYRGTFKISHFVNRSLQYFFYLLKKRIIDKNSLQSDHLDLKIYFKLRIKYINYNKLVLLLTFRLQFLNPYSKPIHFFSVNT